MSKRIPHEAMTGRHYGRLVVLSFSHSNNLGKRVYWCLCDCGTKHLVVASALRSGHTRSCGCLLREIREKGLAHRTHGGAKTAEHTTWGGVKDRVFNPNNSCYHLYGGRGIRMHPAWVNSFEQFLADVGPRPSPQHSLDRYPDNNGNYEPGNVRWATPKEQCRNNRRNILFTINGETRCLTEWCEAYGARESLVRQRVRYQGWEIEEALTLPPGKARQST